MSLVRVRQNAQATISHTFSVDEAATDASGPVTYTVNRLDGTLVVTGAATHPGTLGLYTFVLTNTSLVDMFTVDWTGSVGGGTVTVRDYVEVVGGFLFDLSELRALAKDTVRYPTQTLRDVRTEAEIACERICGRAFVPRFARAEIDGNNDFALVLPFTDARTIRAVATGMSQSTRVALTGAGLTSIDLGEAGILSRRGAIWLWGRRNVCVEAEYGFDFPPESIHKASILHARHLLTQGNTAVAERAAAVQNAQGGTTYVLKQPDQEMTGLPAVDAAYAKYHIDAGFA